MADCERLTQVQLAELSAADIAQAWLLKKQPAECEMQDTALCQCISHAKYAWQSLST